MPLYEYKCLKDHRFERWLPVVEYNTPQVCDCGQPAAKVLSAPMVRGDIPDYVSPVTGKVVSGRVARREDLRRNHCVEWEPGMREEADRRRQAANVALEKSVDATIEREIDSMPVRKRELLYQELQGGVSAEYSRK